MKSRDKRALRSREAAAQRREVVTRAREQVGDPSFDRDARKRYWSRLWRYSLVGVGFLVICIFGYAYTAAFSEVVAVGVSVTAFLLSIYVLANSRVCGACGGQVSTKLPVYCHECGQTYIFHKAGRRKFLQARERLEAQVQADIEAHRRKYGYQEQILKNVERALRVRDHNYTTEKDHQPTPKFSSDNES